jgi:ASC-1-like (ASCH) protein
MIINNQPSRKATAWRRKIWPEYFELVSSGKKKFELRLNDFDVKEGDTLVLEEWDGKLKKYTGRKIEKKVGYVLKFKLDDFGQEKQIKEKGLVVIQME